MRGLIRLPHYSDVISFGNFFAFGAMRLLLPGQQELHSPLRTALGLAKHRSRRARVPRWHQFCQLWGMTFGTHVPCSATYFNSNLSSNFQVSEHITLRSCLVFRKALLCFECGIFHTGLIFWVIKGINAQKFYKMLGVFIPALEVTGLYSPV